MSTDPTAMGKLTDALAAIPPGIASLRADVHRAEAARKKANRINTVLLVVAVALAAVVTVLLVQNNKLTREVKATNAAIADCTTAGGACYERGQQRTGAAISTLTRISIYVSQCGRLYPGESGPEYDVKIEKCVAERLTRAAAQPGPSAVPSASPR